MKRVRGAKCGSGEQAHLSLRKLCTRTISLSMSTARLLQETMSCKHGAHSRKCRVRGKEFASEGSFHTEWSARQGVECNPRLVVRVILEVPCALACHVGLRQAGVDVLFDKTGRTE